MKRKNYASTTIRGKLRVCRYLSASGALRKHVPHTLRLTLANLKSMSARYSSLYIKPDIGSFGIGVYKLTRSSEGYELISTRKKKQTSRIFYSLSAVLSHMEGGRKAAK